MAIVVWLVVMEALYVRALRVLAVAAVIILLSVVLKAIF